jgi:hypothetical protein
MHFAHNFTWNHPARVPNYAWYKKFEQKGCICKGKSPVSLLCLMQLWTVFGLASNAAHKIQRTKRVMSCSYHKQLPPKSCISIYLWNRRNFNWSTLWNLKIWTMGNVQYEISITRIDLREIGCEAGRWMELAEDRVQ